MTVTDADLAIAVFEAREGGGFGVAKRAARLLIAARSGFSPREPLSGQRYLSERARAAVFPVAMGFGVETRMTIDAARSGLRIEEVELDLEHRATGRTVCGFAHRGRQLVELVLACGPQAVNHRGLRLPLVGSLVGLAVPSVLPVAAIGLADDLWSGPERGFRAHLGGVRRRERSSSSAFRSSRSRGHARCPERCSSASRRIPSTNSTPGPGGRSRPSPWARSSSAERRRGRFAWPSSSLPTI